MSDQSNHQHDFDGIEEHDNPLPGWWLSIFWVTIAFAIFYVPYYHFLHPEKLPEAALAAEQERIQTLRASKEVAKPETVNAVITLEDKFQAGGWEEGAKKDFMAYCMACHATDGGGGIGPNFTDDYYIHGGQLADMIKVITDGVPEKGMVSWKTLLKPNQIEALAFYIRSLRGTTPANPKEPQGEQVDADGQFLQP